MLCSLAWKIFLDLTVLTFGVLKLGQVRNPSFNFQKHNLIFSKIIRWISSKIVKSQKITWHWGLGYRNYIWATWAQEIYWAISSECQLQFPWTRPHFLKSYNMNPVKWWNVKKKFDLGVWGLETAFRPLGLRRHIKP